MSPRRCEELARPAGIEQHGSGEINYLVRKGVSRLGLELLDPRASTKESKKKGGENWRGRRNVVKRGREEGEKGKGVKDLVARGNR